jgi:class 3 adenylate cyclase/predicted ATPase
VVICGSCGQENPEGARFCNACAAPLEAGQVEREQRKTVTIVFCDVTGSTELGESTDPETLRALLAGYFARMKGIIEAHGGSVEKFIGDAVMAVFGVPVTHEDDALRACRAAVEMRDALPELGIAGRIGVNTGEVVTGTAERLATGDAVNVAARLEQAAQPGEVLVGEPTLGLVRGAVEVEAAGPLKLQGKLEPVMAYRLVTAAGETPRRHEMPMVGRVRERRLLADAWERAVSERSCHLFTILGPAGVGKSRLVAEFLAAVDGANVVRGRCLPYGEGITYWPVVEVVKQLGALPAEPAAVAAIRSLLRESVEPTTAEEIAWAVRKLFEQEAAKQPLVCVLDDVHWGEETLLDLVEHVADLSREAPILLVCVARPDLLDRRADWAGGKVNATTVLLEPLDPEETDLLLDNLTDLGAPLRDRIREASEGNPLFVEEMVAMLAESPEREVGVPPTIQALLAARLDQLDSNERDVLQCGSVEGRVFHRGGVQALAPDELQLNARLTSLVRKELVRPDRPQLPGEDAFRFRHLLIREAAYDALPKAVRADLHERFAEWLDARALHLVERDEIIGYHLEQAYRHRLALGPVDEPARTLAIRAARRLSAAGELALSLGDRHAAANLLGRSAQLLPENDAARPELLARLGIVLGDLADYPSAMSMLDEAVSRAASVGDERSGAYARLARHQIERQLRPDTYHEHGQDDAFAAIAIFEATGDERGLAYATRLLAVHRWDAMQLGDAAKALRQAIEHAQRAGDRTQELAAVFMLANALSLGPTPVSEAQLELDRLERSAEESLALEEAITVGRATLAALTDRFEESRALTARSLAICAELGLTSRALFLRFRAAHFDLIADDAETAEREARFAYDELTRLQERGWRSTAAAALAEALAQLQRYEEALHFSEISEEIGVREDVINEILWRIARALAMAGLGELADAEQLAREAVDIARKTDAVMFHTKALAVLARLLQSRGQREEAIALVAQAISLAEQKEAPALARLARSALAGEHSDRSGRAAGL